ncbi:glycosyltransferase involved in cell wall biosynthesis [Pacificimonas flava]|nr:glycosyltransferase involved in cell wall biosynthesis [Pacificimonas flava]
MLLDRDPEKYELPGELDVVRLDCRHKLLKSVAGVQKAVSDFQPDLTLSFLTRANLAAVAAGLRFGHKVVLSERVNTTAHLATGRFPVVSHLMVKHGYRHADRIIAVSDGVAATLQSDFSLPGDRIDIIPNPVDAARIMEAARAEPDLPIHADDITAMGRLVPNKNFALLIRAFARSEWPGRLIILGEGPERDSLERLGRELGLGARLSMPGFVANPYAVIARSGLFVLPSRAEGFSNSLVEAMACGVPVISTDCPSGPALIMQKEKPIDKGTALPATGGFLVRMDDTDGMSAAINQMLDLQDRTIMATAGTNRVEAFSVRRAVERYWAVIDDVLGANAKEG